MPAKNIVKKYLEDGYYHIYNRGVEKRKIFQDSQDYKVFLSYLKDYLEPRDEIKLKKALEKISYSERDKIIKQLTINNFSDQIDLLAYCLMPNHFHLLIKQKTKRGIESFMKSLGTRYVIYFNKRHSRIGGLFQDAYKAVLVKTDEQLLHLSRYIHQNPSKKGPTFLNYPYSSLGEYLGKWQLDWLKPKAILAFFSKTNKNFSYKSFVLEDESREKSYSLIENLTIE